jgi:hypothetical protein
MVEKIIPHRIITLSEYTILKKLMFTLSDISTAHARVKSGADFPQYARELITL